MYSSYSSYSTGRSSPLRRCSALGPPSLEHNDRRTTPRTSDSSAGIGGHARHAGTVASSLSMSPSVPGTRAASTSSLYGGPVPLGVGRAKSLTEGFEDMSIKMADLDFYYGLVKRQLLRYQCPTTGLFPEHASDLRVGCVRSSIYANMAAWSLFQAFKRIDDDRGKSYELGQSAVLGMRGILACWMRQAPQLERFKSKQIPAYALHSRFLLDTGSAVASVDEYNHLQLDIVALYLLFLVQAIFSGLQIIYTMDEVCFVQNLVYYVERAYRTPDFGMWQRGSKYNNGTCEVNASSIGMAKAALEAINGFNLFGEKGASWSVIYVDIDAHNRNRSIFETLLPRESETKEVDAALLPTMSFPAFATHDLSLYQTTKDRVVHHLECKYGFKRFPRDGFGTVLEDLDVNVGVGTKEEQARRKRGFYPEGKIQEFSHVESEWPIFFAFMVIDGVFKNNEQQVSKYQQLLRKRLVFNDRGDPVLPKFFYVPSESISDEKSHPGSQQRVHTTSGLNGQNSKDDLFLFGQAMLIISDLLTSQLLNMHDLDPIHRHLPSYNRPKIASRYSAFEKGGGAGVTSSDLVVQVVTIAESMRLQAVLATYGIQTQTPNEIEPVQIWSQLELVKVYQHLGQNKALGIQGRPPRPIGSLGTSKVYRLGGKTVLCYPLIFSASEFYLSHDLALLTDDIKSELTFISKCWRLSGRPTVCILVTENNMRDPQFNVMLSLLSELRSGSVSGVKVRLGRVQNLLASSCVEHLDFCQELFDTPSATNTPTQKRFTQLDNGNIGYQTLTDIPKLKAPVEEQRDFITEYKNESSSQISSAITSCTHLYGTIQLLGLLFNREGGEYMVGELSVQNRLELLNRKAGSSRHWAAVRYSSSLLKQMVDSISPFVTQILASGRQVTVGTIGMEYSLFDKPISPGDLRHAIYTKVQPFNVIAAVLQQELILYCGKLVLTKPQLFTGMIKLRVGWVLRGLDLYRKMKQSHPMPLENCSPSEIRHLLCGVLEESKALQLTYSKKNKKQEQPACIEQLDRNLPSPAPSARLSIYQVRQINGCLIRVPESFYEDMYLILKRSPGGIRIGKHHIQQEPALTQMTSTELTFGHLIEVTLNSFDEPAYRQMVVECFCVLASVLKRNPELEFLGNLCAETLIKEAIAMFKKDQEIPMDEDIIFYNASVSTTSGYLARAVVNNMLKGSILRNSSKKNDNEDDYNCPVQ